jgi:hypothetical protein
MSLQNYAHDNYELVHKVNYLKTPRHNTAAGQRIWYGDWATNGVRIATLQFPVIQAQLTPTQFPNQWVP